MKIYLVSEDKLIIVDSIVFEIISYNKGIKSYTYEISIKDKSNLAILHEVYEDCEVQEIPPKFVLILKSIIL